MENSFTFIAVYSNMFSIKKYMSSEWTETTYRFQSVNVMGVFLLLPGNQVDIHCEVQIDQFSWVFLFVPHIKFHGIL